MILARERSMVKNVQNNRDSAPLNWSESYYARPHLVYDVV